MGEVESIYNQVVAKKFPFADWVDREMKETEAWADHAEGKNDEAIGYFWVLHTIADKEQMGVFGTTGDLPAREMLYLASHSITPHCAM